MSINKLPGFPAESIQQALVRFGFSISAFQAGQISSYITLLTKWNQVVSLTSVTDAREILTKHFVESFLGAKFACISRGRLADVGSGAGFPGLALKILCPELGIHLIESNARKCAFLKEVSRTLGLDAVEVFSGRLEAVRVAAGSLDYVTARAVGQFEDICHWAASVLRPRGSLVLWVGLKDSASLQGLTSWTWRKSEPLPGSSKRVILVGSPARG